VLALSLPLWMKAERHTVATGTASRHIPFLQAVRTPGLLMVLLSYVCFVGFEATAGVWAATLLEQQKGFDPASAALFSSLYFLGTTLGRGISGFVAMKVDSRRMIRFGFFLALSGGVLLALPLPREVSLAAFVLLGLGNAPIFPSMTFLTPQRFGNAVSQTAIGLQMAAAYAGSTLIPPAAGLLVKAFSLQAVPYVVLFFIILGLYFSEQIDRRIKPQKTVS